MVKTKKIMNEIFTAIDRGVKKEAKYCEECGRIFTNRKKWGSDFVNIRFCSKTCKDKHKKVI